MLIHKYKIPPPNAAGISRVAVPRGTTPISVGIQNDEMVLWALAGSNGGEIGIPLVVLNTGVEIDISFGRFLGTVIASSGIVWHVFLGY